MNNKLALIGISFALFSVPCYALDLRVNVKDIKSNDGMIGCGLHSKAETFPMNPTNEKSVRQLWIQAKQAGVECLFENIQPGTYAVAVSHDLNGKAI